MKKDLIKTIAENARISLSDKEIEEFLPQLNDIIAAFSKLQEIKASNIKPSFHPVEIKQRTREDKQTKPLQQEEALSNAKQKKDGYFKGPRII